MLAASLSRVTMTTFTTVSNFVLFYSLFLGYKERDLACYFKIGLNQMTLIEKESICETMLTRISRY